MNATEAVRPLAQWVQRVLQQGDRAEDGDVPTLVGLSESDVAVKLKILLSIPDGYLRHRRLALAVLSQFDHGSVLSVGDPFAQLSTYLPGFDITATDVADPLPNASHRGPFIKADFTNSAGAFPPASFDLVVSTDVLEHIPGDRRFEFLAQAARVARRTAFIAFPAGPDARHAEAMLRSSKRHTTFRAALNEHASHGLPEVQEVEAMLERVGLAYEIRPLTTLSEWLTSFVFELDGSDGQDPTLLLEYFEFLNGIASEAPGSGPAYRYLAVVQH